MSANEIRRTSVSNIAPLCDKTLLGSIQRPIDPQKWDRVQDLYEKGRYKEVILGILDYVDSELVARTGNPDQTEFMIPHGSALVKLKIDNGHFHVTAPFLTVPTTSNIPLLRQVAQINLFPLNLANIVLENHQLIFKYSCPLALCEPYKIYDVLREICTFADNYDDEFIKKFSAQWIHKPVIKVFPQKYLDLAWQRVRQYLKETGAYIDYFEKGRIFEFCLDVIIITLMKIDYYIVPQGILRTDIEKTLAQLHDPEFDLMDKIRKGKEYINRLQNYDKSDFCKDLYVAEVFIPLKLNFTTEMIESYFQDYYDTAKKELANRDYTGAALTMQKGFFNLFYSYIVPQDIKEVVSSALVKTSQKPWEQASSTLLEAMENVLSISSQQPRKKKGFWGKLLGNIIESK